MRPRSEPNPSSTFSAMPLSPELTTIVESTKGFMPVREAAALFDAATLATPGVWLEIGTYCGKSTVVLGGAAKAAGATVIALDHHRGSEENQIGWEWHDESLVAAPNAANRRARRHGDADRWQHPIGRIVVVNSAGVPVP